MWERTKKETITDWYVSNVYLYLRISLLRYFLFQKKTRENGRGVSIFHVGDFISRICYRNFVLYRQFALFWFWDYFFGFTIFFQNFRFRYFLTSPDECYGNLKQNQYCDKMRNVVRYWSQGFCLWPLLLILLIIGFGHLGSIWLHCTHCTRFQVFYSLDGHHAILVHVPLSQNSLKMKDERLGTLWIPLGTDNMRRNTCSLLFSVVSLHLLNSNGSLSH